MKTKITLFIVGMLLFACHKDKPIAVDPNLTGCPVNSSCTYNYYDQADFSAINPLTHGNNRVFLYSRSNGGCGPTSQFYVKTTLSNEDFTINLSQLASGQMIAYNNGCPCCARAGGLIPVIGCEIKGRRVNTTHWLINARIIFGTSSTTPTDSIKVNQYFTLEKLP
jgi:hypothetical protein